MAKIPDRPNPKLAAQNRAKGMSKRQALLQAGYSESTATKASTRMFERPLVQSELTRALARQNITFDKIVKPIADGLVATKSFLHNKLGLITTQEPDHLVRLASADRAIDLMGGVPKVGEAIPASTGLNVFIAVDNGQAERVQPRPAIHPTQPTQGVIDAVPEGSTRPGTRRQQSSPSAQTAVQSQMAAQRPAQCLNVGISIVEDPARQGHHALHLPKNGNGHTNGHSNGSNGNGHQHAIQPDSEF